MMPGDDSAGSASPPPDMTQLSLAADRTRLAYERTMMAWIRTATSLIIFGFSIYKFADILEVGNTGRTTLTPQLYGSAMIVTGLLALLLAVIEHRAGLRRLRVQGVKVPASLAAVVAFAIAILGLGALGLVAFGK